MDEVDDVGEVESSSSVTRAICDLFMSAELQSRFIGTADDLGLTPPMLKALLELEPGDGQPMRQLAEEWGCDASFVTVVVDGLEHRGYARRQVADHDRRVKTVELTTAGAAARRRALDAVYAPLSGCAALAPDERATLAVLLHKVVDAQSARDAEQCAAGKARPWGARGMAARHGHPVRGHPRGRSVAEDAEDLGPVEAVGSEEGWRAHLDAHRQELARLRDELRIVRDEMKAQAKLAKADAKAQMKGRNRGA